MPLRDYAAFSFFDEPCVFSGAAFASNLRSLITVCFHSLCQGFLRIHSRGVLLQHPPRILLGCGAPRARIADSHGELRRDRQYSLCNSRCCGPSRHAVRFRNDGQATFATAGAPSTPQGQGAYDLESLLIHELGHWFGLDHSAVIRAVMLPFALPPGQFLGDRPIFTVPDTALADDDRTGIRAQCPDPNDTLNVGALRGRIVPASLFALAVYTAPYAGASVTGIVGAHVIAVDADTGSIVAGTLAGGSCNPADPPTSFDGSFDLCSATATPTCQTPAANTNLNVRILLATQRSTKSSVTKEKRLPNHGSRLASCGVVKVLLR